MRNSIAWADKSPTSRKNGAWRRLVPGNQSDRHWFVRQELMIAAPVRVFEHTLILMIEWQTRATIVRLLTLLRARGTRFAVLRTVAA
jgi:hypothetical protein